MGLSSRLFLLDTDAAPLRLAEADFARLCQDDRLWRVPVFAGLRVRWASMVVELFNRLPIRVVHRSLGYLQFDEAGDLDVDRMSREQVARLDALFGQLPAPTGSASVIDATSRFAARGGTWQPEAELAARIEAAALGRLPCPRVRLVA